MLDGVDGCTDELLEPLPLLLLPRGKNTSPLPFGCEHDGLGGGLLRIPGVPVYNESERKNIGKKMESHKCLS